jgi:hypothetical protein
MNYEDYAKDQLSYTYDRIESDQNVRAQIENWCVTVWLASLAAAASIDFKKAHGLMEGLPFLPVLFFWLLDGIYQVFIAARRTHARRLEEMLLGMEKITPEALLPISVEFSRGRDLTRSLWKQIVKSYFWDSTVVSFYVPLIIVTALFYRSGIMELYKSKQ